MRRRLRCPRTPSAFLSPCLLAMALLASACSGIRESNGTFVAHGECVRVLGFAIPRDDQQAALDRVPEGGTITTVDASTADWKSLRGFFGNLLGYHCTEIGGTK